jgi:hypothetical protein
MRYDRDAVSPWSFFLPVALAVLVGSLVADAIGHALRDRFAATPVAVVETPVAVAAPVATPTVEAAVAPEISPPVAPLPQVVEAPHPDAALLAEPAGTGASPAIAEAADAGVRRLSGPITARQAGESESCINNTVATRSPNGWEQALENDAPVRCEASSN